VNSIPAPPLPETDDDLAMPDVEGAVLNSLIKAARNGKQVAVLVELKARFDEASYADVKVDLIVRDTCRFRPGIRGLSENARVVSIVGRFLEHARIIYFRNGGNEEYYIGSADMMQRNLESRVEVQAPVEDADARDGTVRTHPRPLSVRRRRAPRLASQHLHPAREGEVEPGDAVRRMGPQVHAHPLVDVGPLGMMIHGFRHQCDPGHETEGLDEVRERELLVQLAVDQCPGGRERSVELLQGAIHCGRIHSAVVHPASSGFASRTKS
jgi:hypothetical protein